MKTVSKFWALVALAAILAGPAKIQASDLLFSQPVDNQSTFGPSQLWPATNTNSEVTDDFDVVGNIDRVIIDGFVWGTVQFQGVYVRFYAGNTDGTPGALQQQYFFSGGMNPASTGGMIDVQLVPAFVASGKHFISVQPVSDYWYWWSSHSGAARGQQYYFRDNAAAQPWRHSDSLNQNPNADVAFSLYGTSTAPGLIDHLSTTTLPRSGFLEILGTNFGGDGKVLIGGIAAPVSSWSSTRIVAYVPEAAALGTVSVQIVTQPGSSNTVSLNVTSRPPANGHVNWRFRMDGPYSQVTPAVAPDGTIYSVDAFFHLYAVAPDGGLKWVVRGAGDKGVDVGPDGTIYTASEDAIKAFYPDGSAKWTFIQNPRAFICLDVAVGPDGNIYSVATEGLGAFSLTPNGQLRWAVPEGYARLIVDYADIVFGANGANQQLYFGANNHTRAVRLDGTPVFTLTPGSFQPAIGPDGSIHSALGAYSPSGSLLWNFLSPYPYNTFSRPDVGPDGIHYFTQNTIQLFALNSGGSKRWQVTLANSYGAPALDPANSMLVMGSANTLDIAGSIKAVTASAGKDLWTVTLPPEDPTVFNAVTGMYGYNQGVNTRGVYSKDGKTVYFLTSTATASNETSRSFIYALATGATVVVPAPTPTATVAPSPTPMATPTVAPSPTPLPVPTPTPVVTATPTATATPIATPIVSPVLRSTNIALTGKSGKISVSANGTVTIEDGKGALVTGAAVDITWLLPNGASQTQSALTSTRGTATFTISGSPGAYTFTITDVRKPGYTFDSANSVLMKSITPSPDIRRAVSAVTELPAGSPRMRSSPVPPQKILKSAVRLLDR